MSNNDEFHTHPEYCEVHNRYSEIGPSTAWLKGKLTFSKVKQKTTAAISGLFTTVAAVGIAVFLFTPFFNATVESLSSDSATVNVSASFGISDYRFPLYYTLTEVADADGGKSANSTVIENNEIDNLGVSSKEVETEDGASGIVTSFASELDFDNLKPNTTYLLRLRLEAADDDQNDLLCSLTFKTSSPKNGGGGGSGHNGGGSQGQQTPDISPTASASPSPSESPSPSPSESPSPSPSESPSPTPPPYHPPAPDVTPTPTAPPTVPMPMSVIDGGTEGAVFPDNVGGTFYVKTDISEFGENLLTNIVYGSSSPISTSQGRLILTLDPYTEGARVVDLPSTIINKASSEGGLTGISIDGIVNTDAITAGVHTYNVVLEYLGSEGETLRFAGDSVIINSTTLTPPEIAINAAPAPQIVQTGANTVRATYTLNLSGSNISTLNGSYVEGTSNTGKLSVSFEDSANNTYPPTVSTTYTMSGSYISELAVTADFDFGTTPPSTLDITNVLEYKYSYLFHEETLDYPTASVTSVELPVLPGEP